MPETPRRPPAVLADRCTGCGACVAACRPDAIHLSPLPDGRKRAVVDEDVCQLHGDCLRACPHDALWVPAGKWRRPATGS